MAAPIPCKARKEIRKAAEGAMAAKREARV
jgi:hypothetical protein